MESPSDFSPASPDPESSLEHAARYNTWLKEVKPRTCLLVHWLAGLGAVPDPGDSVRRKAQHFASKRCLLGQLVDQSGGDTCQKIGWLLANREFDLYVTYLMWLRFNEYVPRSFVLPEGRTQVLNWVRSQLRRPELTDDETIAELHWQAERLRSGWGEPNEWQMLRAM